MGFRVSCLAYPQLLDVFYINRCMRKGFYALLHYRSCRNKQCIRFSMRQHLYLTYSSCFKLIFEFIIGYVHSGHISECIFRHKHIAVERFRQFSLIPGRYVALNELQVQRNIRCPSLPSGIQGELSRLSTAIRCFYINRCMTKGLLCLVAPSQLPE